MSATNQPVTSSTIVVAVDVGKSVAAISATTADRHRLFGPVEITMTVTAVADLTTHIQSRIPADAQVKLGIEAAGHYHHPMLDHSWPTGWEVLEVNPARVGEQRRINGKRRVKTDAIDLEAITDLVLAGQGQPASARPLVIEQITALTAHRTRRVLARTAVKNQLISQLDRSFPGLTLALPRVLDTKIGRLIIAEFADPARLRHLGTAKLIRFAGNRGLQLRQPVAERLIAAAREAMPTHAAPMARQILAQDAALLADLDAQIGTAEAQLAALLPDSDFATLTTVPGWGVVRVANYGGALGDPDRWPGPRQVYRASGLSPMQYESAGRRRDGKISREGSVRLRRALIDLGLGLWLIEPAARARGAELRARGMKGKVIACTMANRANRIAFAMVRDHTAYEPARWA
ncbi:IS110 family transposase [Tomitella biformata]|uniref:IS110 family transposase n=1 Tax=Tomitella biformata TaxID=630403 RepID=UPI00046737E1|nr:IS110 family transposase [Tomitella biformata]